MSAYSKARKQDKKPQKKESAFREILFFMPFVLIGLAITVGLMLVFSFLYVILPFMPENIGLISSTIRILVLFLISFLAGKTAGNAGWFVGGAVGIIYMLVATFFGVILFTVNLLSADPLINLAAGFIIGAIGGIVGVSAQTRKSRSVFIRRKF